jgi:hypothetical protein
MSCLECTDCLSIGVFDLCCESITLAMPVVPDKYKVVITDVTLGTMTSYTNGEVTSIDFSPNEGTYTAGRTYEVRIYPQDACDFNTPQEMTNDLHEDPETCFSFQLKRLS